MFVTVVIHYPKAEYKDTFFAYMQRIKQGMQDTPGLLYFDGFQDIQEDRLVAIAHWETPETFQAALPKMFAIGGREKNWSARPDEIFKLTS